MLAINNWNEEYERVFLGGLTCDSMDYYNSEAHSNAIFLPRIGNGDVQYIGLFHTGAYQESIGGYGGLQHCLIPAPKHIIIDKDARVKILDFGLAKLKGVSKLTKNSSTIGTIHYMSPEQIQGKDVDHRSDIWSIGIVFYELLAGKVPFKGDYDQAVAYSIQTEEFEPIHDIGQEHAEILQKLLAKNPEDRYQN